MPDLAEIRAILEENGWWPLAIAMVESHGCWCDCNADLSERSMFDWPLDHIRPTSIKHRGPADWTPECLCGCNDLNNLANACRD